ncbi:conserved virulence factor C family protein [Marininema halotolerans]|uniref:HEAT repeat-containing protein n=1 Tax=Marininema halotolerans TaxID=1155944 RepID=A0A1I6NZW2_9BACL|nr:conserved virulence factor C family protein [Marininema halotolerans]SFS33348.1 HEAT repeat-containing protein [Marininema halotolerans]
MQIKSIEPTPSPHSMKVNLDQKVSKGATYTVDRSEDAPEYVKHILAIQGVKSIFHVADFLAIDRDPKVEWQQILPQVREIFGEKSSAKSSEEGTSSSTEEAFGEVKVFLQTFRGLPIQLKLVSFGEEKRYSLPERFAKAVMEAQSASANMVMERKWEERGVRYGEWDEVGNEAVQEIAAAYDDARLQELIKQAFAQGPGDASPMKRHSYPVTLEMMEDPDWRKRYAALEQMNPTLSDLPVLSQALSDEKATIRRLAVAYLGSIEEKEVLPLLLKAMHDPSVTVRRTAGDCLSDLGDPEATPVMIEALRDPSRLVRWRAAMFLYESGDTRAISALSDAQNDSEFEVAMQARMALERIEKGDEASGSVWRQMTNRNQSSEG